MTRRWSATILAFAVCAAFAIGWFTGYRAQKMPSKAPVQQTIDGQPASVPAECSDDTPDEQWDTVKVFEYRPNKTTYVAEWQACPAVIGRRVRVMDDNYHQVFFEFEDDEVLRVEGVELFSDGTLQLLITTGSAGTNDRTDWHILSEMDGNLREWMWPDYDAPAQKLLRSDEDFCCKAWSLYLAGQQIVLARGIYEKGRDGNCCPSRGGAVAWLTPVQGGFKLTKIQRVNKAEYYRLMSAPFCSKCTLIGP
jgi:hypothetical protein